MKTYRIRDAVYDLKHNIFWHSFSDVGIEDSYHLWACAEQGCYIIHDLMMDTYFFAEAKSPKEIYNIYRKRIEEVRTAGHL